MMMTTVNWFWLTSHETSLGSISLLWGRETDSCPDPDTARWHDHHVACKRLCMQSQFIQVFMSAAAGVGCIIHD